MATRVPPLIGVNKSKVSLVEKDSSIASLVVPIGTNQRPRSSSFSRSSSSSSCSSSGSSPRSNPVLLTGKYCNSEGFKHHTRRGVRNQGHKVYAISEGARSHRGTVNGRHDSSHRNLLTQSEKRRRLDNGSHPDFSSRGSDTVGLKYPIYQDEKNDANSQRRHSGSRQSAANVIRSDGQADSSQSVEAQWSSVAVQPDRMVRSAPTYIRPGLPPATNYDTSEQRSCNTRELYSAENNPPSSRRGSSNRSAHSLLSGAPETRPTIPHSSRINEFRPAGTFRDNPTIPGNEPSGPGRGVLSSGSCRSRLAATDSKDFVRSRRRSGATVAPPQPPEQAIGARHTSLEASGETVLRLRHLRRGQPEQRRHSNSIDHPYRRNLRRRRDDPLEHSDHHGTNRSATVDHPIYREPQRYRKRQRGRLSRSSSNSSSLRSSSRSRSSFSARSCSTLGSSFETRRRPRRKRLSGRDRSRSTSSTPASSVASSSTSEPTYSSSNGSSDTSSASSCLSSIRGRARRHSRGSSAKRSRLQYRRNERERLSKYNRRPRRQSMSPPPDGAGKGSDAAASLEDRSLAEYTDRKISKITIESIGRLGGVYIPPFKLAALQQAASHDKSSPVFQRQSWEALRKSLNGLVNKVNVANMSHLVEELFRENLMRGRGLFARALLHAQMASPGFSHIYAALLAIVNSKLPEVGDLVLRRLLLQFRRAYRRNDRVVCVAVVKMFAQLVNQKVIHDVFALQLAALLLSQLTDDSVEVCVVFLKEVGQVLKQLSPQGFNAIFDRLRAILHEGSIDAKVQLTVEALFDAHRLKFADFPGVLPELDLVEEDDKITHELDLLDPNITGEETLNLFKPLPPEEFAETEASWSKISREILGEESDTEEDTNANVGAASDGEGDNESSVDSEADYEGAKLDETGDDSFALSKGNDSTIEIKDLSEQDVVNLRKTIYLTIMSSASFEECVHKILKLNIKSGYEVEVCTMLIDCCAMERTFQRFFPLQAERLCRVQSSYRDCFMECFKRQYQAIHRLETNKLRNCAKFFAHLLHTDALPWSILQTFVLTEATTTSASRIFIKIVFQELSEHMGLRSLFDRLHEPELSPYLMGIFPSDHPKHIRFAINFFTAIGLGSLTEDLRETLKGIQATT